MKNFSSAWKTGNPSYNRIYTDKNPGNYRQDNFRDLFYLHGERRCPPLFYRMDRICYFPALHRIFNMPGGQHRCGIRLAVFNRLHDRCMFLIGLFRPFFILQGIFTHLLDIFMKRPQHMFQQMAAGGRIHQLMKPVIGNIYLFPVSLLPVKLGHIKNFLHGFHLGIRNMLHAHRAARPSIRERMA